MRALLHRRADGQSALYWYNNSGAHVVHSDDDKVSRGMHMQLRRLLCEPRVAAPGLYRVSISEDDDRCWATLGRAIVNPAREAARIRARLAREPNRVHTDKPGVQGYQQREDASRAAQEAAWRVAQQIAARLEAIACEG